MAEQGNQPKGESNIFKGWNKKLVLSNLKVNWELIPLVVLPFTVSACALYMLFRTSTTAPDIRWTNKGDSLTAPQDSVKPDQQTKLYTRDPSKYRPIGDLEAIKEDMKTAK